MEIPYTGRAVINELFDRTEIIIPARKNWFIVIFLGFWLCGWLFGEIMVGGSLLGGMGSGPSLFMLIWLGGWTVGGAFAIRTFFWVLIGKEVIEAGQGVLTIKKVGALFYKPRSYDLKEARQFRVQDHAPVYGPFGSMRMNNMWNLNSSGVIRFDYGMKTVRFADGVEEAEAKAIIAKLKDKRILSEFNFN